MVAIYRTYSGHPEIINGELWAVKVLSSRTSELDPLVLQGVLVRDDPPIYSAIAAKPIVKGRVITGTSQQAFHATGPETLYLGISLNTVSKGGVVLYKTKERALGTVGNYPLVEIDQLLVSAPEGKLVQYIYDGFVVVPTTVPGGGFDHFDNSVWAAGSKIYLSTLLDDSFARGVEVTFHMLNAAGDYVIETLALNAINSSIPIIGTELCWKLLGVRVGTASGVFEAFRILNGTGPLADTCFEIVSPQTGWYGFKDGTAIEALGHRLKLICNVVINEPILLMGTDGDDQLLTEVISEIPSGGVYTTKGYKTIDRLLIGGDDAGNVEYQLEVESNRGKDIIGSVVRVAGVGEDAVIDLEAGILLIDGEAKPGRGDYKESARYATNQALSANDYDNGEFGHGATITAQVNGSIAVIGIDSATDIILGDRILVKDEAISIKNGIYNVIQLGGLSSPWVFQRTEDADHSTKVNSGSLLYVSEGSVNARTYFVLETPDPVEIGATGLSFVEVSGAGGGPGLYFAGDGIDIDTLNKIISVDLYATGGLDFLGGDQELGIKDEGITANMLAISLDASAIGFDADLLDGQHASAFSLITHIHNASDVNNDSSIPGSDVADALDNLDSDLGMHLHDNVYYPRVDFLDSSAGIGDAGEPVKLDSDGHIDSTMLNDLDIDHNSVSGLQGGSGAERYHLTTAQHIDLTSGGASTTHVHEALILLSTAELTGKVLTTDGADGVTWEVPSVHESDVNITQVFAGDVLGGAAPTDLEAALTALDLHSHSHAFITDLSADDHTQYSLADGSRAFTGTVSGIDPVLPADLVTKDYVDSFHDTLDFQGSVISFEIEASAVQTLGNRYIASANGASWIQDNLYERLASSWKEIVPTEGMLVWVETGNFVVYTSGTWKQFGEVIDHNVLKNLTVGDVHTQYHNDTRGDIRYYTQTQLDPAAILGSNVLDSRYFTEAEFLNVSAGVGDAGKPVILDANGHIDATMLNDLDVDHNSVNGLQGGSGGERYHLTSAEHSGLTGGSDTTLHTHEGNILQSTGELTGKVLLSDGVNGAGWQTPIVAAVDATVDTSAFNALLSGTEDTIQKALDVLDDHIHDDRYFTETESDARYYQQVEHINASVGGADAGKPVVLDSRGRFSASFIEFSDIDHGQLSGTAEDDHLQYLTFDLGTPSNGRGYHVSSFISTSAGAGDAGKPITLNGSGKVDATMINTSVIDHTTLLNIGTNSHAAIDSHISDVDPHREINDLSTSLTELWSSNKINAELSAISSGYNRRKAVINVVDNTVAPPTEVNGDRYILDNTGGGVHGDWDGAAINEIVEFDGASWVATSPDEGWVSYVDTLNKDALFVDDGTPAWEVREIAVSNHGDLLDLSADDHPQYHNDTRGDVRYYTQTLLDAGQLDNRYYTEAEHISVSAGLPDSGKPIVLNGDGRVDASMIDDADVDHSLLGNLGNDDHTQYLDYDLGSPLSARGFHRTTFKNVRAGAGDAGLPIVLDGSGYIDPSFILTSGLPIDHNILNNLTVGDAHTQYHNDTRGDIRYFTQTQLDPGAIVGSNVLDSRYFVESEFITVGVGAGDVGKPIVLNASGYVDNTLIDSASFVTDHGGLSGLGDNDHSQYLLTADALTLYYLQTQFISVSSGAGDAGKPILLDLDGKVDASMVDDADVNHGNLGGLAGDHHLQYHNDTRGDIRYYTKTLLDAGQLDNRYYTETELDAGQLNTLYYTKTLLNAGQLDTRYYTETELDAGQLDNRYFTEVEHINVSTGVADAGKPLILDAAGLVDSSMLDLTFLGDYYLKTEFINFSTGAGDTGKPVVLDANGHIDATMIFDEDINHGDVAGLDQDDHQQYILLTGNAIRNAVTGFIDMSGGRFILPQATDIPTAIPTGVEGELAWDTDDDILYVWDGTQWIVVAGGGGGGGDHGVLAGLGDDDHTQYHTDARGDARYYQQSEHINTSTGVADAGKPIILNASGKVSGTMLPPAAGNIVKREIPTGSIDGSNTVFTLANTPTAGLEDVYLNGMLLVDPDDYALSGNQVTMVVAPAINDKIWVSYYY